MSGQINQDRNFVEISNLIKMQEFEQVKGFILKNGDRQTYRNFDGNNPHYNFKGFHVFLGAETGQGNINNDPDISGFNQLTIADRNASIIYYEIIIVRKGDLINSKSWLKEGMKEGEVYLVDVYNMGLQNMKNKLPAYFEQLRSEIKDH